MYSRSTPLGVDPRQIAQVSRRWAAAWAQAVLVPWRRRGAAQAQAAGPGPRRRQAAALTRSPHPHPHSRWLPAPLCALQRIMEVRAQIAREWIEELKQVGALGRWVRVVILGGRGGARCQARGLPFPPPPPLSTPLSTPLLAHPSQHLSQHPCSLAPPLSRQVDEENALLMRETVASAFTLDQLLVADPAEVRCSKQATPCHIVACQSMP